ncbi:hypothetical protein [[Actinomadura] parvosata]|uniref:hypothetical protein n=1 Tax=[Actinomadura] parvosata TaxID=1955412 RepID=UPI001E5F5419|nr:hypothetical protein [Nonomuraea sp. ATCC 55076]
MSTDGLSVDDGIRTLLLLMPRMVGRAKRLKVPEELRELSLAPGTCHCWPTCCSTAP